MVAELPKLVADNIEHFTGRAWLVPKLLDWYEKSDERILMLVGGPGTGKSMIMAWLAGHGPAPDDPEIRGQLEQLRAQVKAVHFCMAASRNITPQATAENIANQLTQNVPGFAGALAATLAERVQIAVTQNVGPVQAGGSVTGVSIARIDLGALGDELSFDRAFSQPLKKLYGPTPWRPTTTQRWWSARWRPACGRLSGHWVLSAECRSRISGLTCLPLCWRPAG
jgi:hypothetical protein